MLQLAIFCKQFLLLVIDYHQCRQSRRGAGDGLWQAIGVVAIEKLEFELCAGLFQSWDIELPSIE